MSGGRGKYDRAAARARREAEACAALERDVASVAGSATAPTLPPTLVIERPISTATGQPGRIRLLAPVGFVDDIGAVYGPKPVGYETSNSREIAVLIERGEAYEAVP